MSHEQKRMDDDATYTRQCLRTAVTVIAIVQRVVVLVVILLCYPALLVPVVLLQRGELLPLDLLARVLIEDPHFGRARPLARGPLYDADVAHGATALARWLLHLALLYSVVYVLGRCRNRIHAQSQ